MQSSPILEGSNRIPGQWLSNKEKDVYNKILQVCWDFGCRFFPIIIQPMNSDQLHEVVAYTGFPCRFKHWKWGMAYESFQKSYEYNQFRIFELILNNNPSIMYILNSNSFVDNLTVVAHAGGGHSDFFKNNIFFEPTIKDAVAKFSTHARRIDLYIERYGKEAVTEFIDRVMSIETLIDPAKAWDTRQIKEVQIIDKKEHEFPVVLPSSPHMHDWVNTQEFKKQEKERIARLEASRELNLFTRKEKDIFGFIKDHAPLKPWQQDIMNFLYEEAMYFAPQRQTKTINEGWAVWIHDNIMAKSGFASYAQDSDDIGITNYALQQMHILGGTNSVNPYRLGFYLLNHIEDVYNKGKFGVDYENCQDQHKKQHWDQNLGLGKEKVFEVRKNHNDFTLINEFFTPEFCRENNYFEWKKENEEYIITGRDFKNIKNKMLQNYVSGGLPDIRLVDTNFRNENTLFIEHVWDGRILQDNWARSVLANLYSFWKNDCVLSTKNKDGEEIVYFCAGSEALDDVVRMTASEFEGTK